MGSFQIADVAIGAFMSALPPFCKVQMWRCSACNAVVLPDKLTHSNIVSVRLNDSAPSIGAALQSLRLTTVTVEAVDSPCCRVPVVDTKRCVVDDAQVLVVFVMAEESQLHKAAAFDLPGWSLRSIFCGGNGHFTCVGLRRWRWPGTDGGEAWYEFDCLSGTVRRRDSALQFAATTTPMFAFYERADNN